ncbi:MAG: hypothetical protein ACXVCP_11205 [Bdellovibrio sp.]
MSLENINAIPSNQVKPEKQPKWNVVVTLREHGLKDAKRALKPYGAVTVTNFFNVLVMQVEDIQDFLHDFAFDYNRKPFLQDSISRLIPIMRSFIFNSREEFETKVNLIVEEWINRIEGKSFYVRMHRRGFKETMSSLDEELSLDNFILTKIHEKEKSARISFSDPDFIIDLETINNQAGISLWSREDLKNYSFLNID